MFWPHKHALRIDPVVPPRGLASTGAALRTPPGGTTRLACRQCKFIFVVQVAETLVFGPDEVGAGATSDLKQATKLARHMVCDCGFSEIVGPMCVDESASQATQQVADKEVLPLVILPGQRYLGVKEPEQR